MILVKKAFSNQILTEHGTRNMKHGTNCNFSIENYL